MKSFWKKLAKLFGTKKPTKEELKSEWEQFQENDPDKLPKPTIGTDNRGD